MNTLHLQFDSIILMISWYVNMMLTSCLTMNLGCLVNFHRIPSRFLVVLVFIIYFNVFRSQRASSCLIVPHRVHLSIVSHRVLSFDFSSSILTVSRQGLCRLIEVFITHGVSLTATNFPTTKEENSATKIQFFDWSGI